MLIFANIAWHPFYDGTGADSFFTTAQWQEKSQGEYGEIYNYLPHRKKMYAYACPHSRHWKADLSKLGGNKSDEFIEGITVVWIAPEPNDKSKRIIGWFENARMYSVLQKRPGKIDGHYLFEAKIENCVLLPVKERKYILDKYFRTLWYALNIEDRSIKEAVSSYISDFNNEDFLTIDPSEIYFDKEGRKKLRKHLQKERSSKLIKMFKSRLESFNCEICGFDFFTTYGELGKGFIEAHHTKPVSSLNEDEKVTIKDLSAVCSNCHRMLHRSSSPITIKKLKQLIKS